jgi:serine/threonine-protein kinase RsbW
VTTPPAAATRVEVATLATRASLPTLLEAATEAAARARIPPDAAADLQLAVEEACVNVIDHGYAGGVPGPIRLCIVIDAHRIVVELVDAAPAFDPSDAPRADLTTGWQQRRIGGLGWHLIRRVMDEVKHESTPGGGNRLTLVRSL